VERVNVDLGQRSYDIVIGPRCLTQVGSLCREVGLSGDVLIISTPRIFELYGEALENSLREADYSYVAGFMDDGEEHKTLETVSHFYDLAIKAGLDRSSFVISLGGGVVGDTAGFLAATYMRGIPFVQVPTTLLALVDSSVGGKVGVDHPKGKNLIGAFHQPSLVVADIDTLKSLEPRHLVSGLAEVIKYGIIWDKEFFRYIDGHLEAILALDPKVLTQIVKRCCEIKAEIVAQDEFDENVREVLNYGHTIGHALETITGYKSYLHGEAIAIGMSLAAQISCALGSLEAEEKEAIDQLLQRAGLAVRPPNWDVQEIFSSLLRDKKVRRGVVRFVLPQGIGKGYVTGDVPRELILDVLRQALTGGTL
jgi:3-dehydroquinate synthase